jgi:plastocyanin
MTHTRAASRTAASCWCASERTATELRAGLHAGLSVADPRRRTTLVQPPQPPPRRNDRPSAPQFGSVSGTVTEGGAGVAGASLQLSRAGATTRNATTAAGGAYQFAEVAAGTWTVALTAPAGYQVAGAAAAQVTVNAGQGVTANVALTRTEPPTGIVEVVASDNSFTSADVTISVNGTIRWRNAGTVEHNATSATALRSSGNLSPGCPPCPRRRPRRG